MSTQYQISTYRASQNRTEMRSLPGGMDCVVSNAQSCIKSDTDGAKQNSTPRFLSYHWQKARPDKHLPSSPSPPTSSLWTSFEWILWDLIPNQPPSLYARIRYTVFPSFIYSLCRVYLGFTALPPPSRNIRGELSTS